MGKVIAVSNQKGGVGKSTTVVNLAAVLGKLGKKVLIVDFDPQGNTTTSFAIKKSRIKNTIFEVITDECELVEAITATEFTGVSVVPTTQNLSGAAVRLLTQKDRALRLRSKLDTARGFYDYVFIDCPPTLDMLTINALAAADSVLIPLQCEFLSLEGLVELSDTIKRVQKSFNPNLSVEGILFTMYVERYKLTSQVTGQVRKKFGSLVFDTVIPRNVAISEAPSYGEPVIYYDKKSKGAKAYEELAKELIRRDRQSSKPKKKGKK